MKKRIDYIERRKLISRFEGMVDESITILWERTGRNYVSSSKGSTFVSSDIHYSRYREKNPMIERRMADGKKEIYAEFDVEGKTIENDEETTIRVYNPDAEEILKTAAQRAGLIKRPLPEGMTWEELGYDGEFYDDGSPGMVNFERAYPDLEWEKHIAKDVEKIRLARERGSSAL